MNTNETNVNVDEIFDDLFGATPESISFGPEETETGLWKKYSLQLKPTNGKPESMMIRYLPDLTTKYPSMRNIAHLDRYRCIMENGDVVYYHSPRTLNSSKSTYCPVADAFFKIRDKKDAALLAEFRRRYAWKPKDIVKVQIINCPSDPTLIGQIFNLFAPKHVKSQIESAIKPTDTDLAMGITPINPFNLPSARGYRLSASLKPIGEGEMARDWSTSAFAPDNYGVYVNVEIAEAAGISVAGMKQINGMVMLTETSGDAKAVQTAIVRHLLNEMNRDGMFFGYEPASAEQIEILKTETLNLVNGKTPIAVPAEVTETGTPAPTSGTDAPTVPLDQTSSDAEADAILNALMGTN